MFHTSYPAGALQRGSPGELGFERCDYDSGGRGGGAYSGYGRFSDGGFASALTASGEEAITLLQDDNSRYRAVVTAINLLGKLDGWEVGRAAREIDPTMPIIYMTGTHGEEWASKGVPNSPVLAKPFAPAQIVTAISQLLNATLPIPPAG